MVKYINNDAQKGVKYSWCKILKKVEALEIPLDFFSPVGLPIDLNSWFVLLSERAIGKTTGILILALVMHVMYGTTAVYCRSSKYQIAPKHTSDLYNVIITNDYVRKITDGEYNSVTYNRRKWYLCTVDENGEITNKDPEPCCHMVAIDEALESKSSLNLPLGDIIIFDEFVTPAGYTPSNEFVMFCDLISTIFRLRESGKIFLLGNTINKYSQYYDDLEISDIVRGMDIGDKRERHGDNKTPVYIEIVKPSANFQVKKRSWVDRFMSFSKPELSSITGRSVWAVENYPHIPDDSYHTISNKIYLYTAGRYIRLEIVSNDVIGVCIYAHWATSVYDDSIILTNELIDTPNKYRYLGNNTLEMFIRKIIRAGKMFYASNDVGSCFNNYLMNK